MTPRGTDYKSAPWGFAAVGFGLAPKKDLACNGEEFDAACSIDENIWNSQVSLQLHKGYTVH